MKMPFSNSIIPPLLALAVAAVAQDQGIKQKLTVKGYLDVGHLVNGMNRYADPSVLDQDISWLPLNRANVIAIQDLSAGNFDVSVGLSGLIWWPYGQGKSANISERVAQVKPMVPLARARWQFGDPAATSGSLQVGSFPYKYNPDAKNLGEYLYRSGTYPGMLFTGEGWLLMNRSGSFSHGLLFSLADFGGALKHNFSLFMETVYYPVGDFSPGYDVAFSSKWLTLGGGAVLNHYLAFRPSQLSPKQKSNAYAEIFGTTAAGADTVVRGRFSQISPPANPTDTNLTYWTSKGVKLMGRASLNLGHLLPESVGGPEDLKLFAEAALLGVKDYPLYYEKKSERMPIMFGVNLPTFRLLDGLSLQGEFYQSRFADANKYAQEGLPIWEEGKIDSSGTGKDDFKWSIHAKKAINKTFTAYVQAASDHFRLTDAAYNSSNIPLTFTPKDWYYLVRLEFNLR